MELKDRIREAMEYAGLTQAEFARATKKTNGAITQWLDGGTKSLKAETAAQISAVTGYNALWLVTGKGPKTGFNLANVAFSGKEIIPVAPTRTDMTLEMALTEVARAMLLADDIAKIQAKPLLAHLIENPSQADKIVHRLVALLDGELPTTETRDFLHAKQPT